jgi:hypothetical protein
MGLQLERQTALSRRRTKTAPMSLALALLVTPSPRWASGEPAPRPPTSIEPSVTKQKVLVSHLHRRVRACTAVPAKHPTACAPQLSDGTATTTVSFDPISTSVGASRRTRIVVTFPDSPGLQKQTVELPLGDWTVNWPGCRDVLRLSLTAAKDVSPRVVLRTTSGRCELESSRCCLVDTAIEQRLAVGE